MAQTTGKSQPWQDSRPLDSAAYHSGVKVIRRVHFGIQLYLLLTEVLFLFGPWEWYIPKPVSLLVFLSSIHLLIFVAYLASNKTFRTRAQMKLAYWHDLPTIPFIKIAVVIGLVLAIPTSLARTGGLIPDVLGGLENVGAAYNENFERISSGNAFVLVEYIRIILSPFLVGQLALIVFFWKLLSPGWRIGGAILVLWTTLSYVAVGTNKGIADLIILAPIFMYFAKVAQGAEAKVVFTFRNLVAAAVFILFLIFFGQTQELRAGGVGVNGVFYTGSNLIYANPNALPAWVSEQWVIIYQSITRYLTQGYQALALSFEVDRTTTFGIGHSFFLTDQASAIFEIDYFEDNNLPALLESRFGWSRFFTWHTAYVWFASDIGFIGTAILVGLFAYLLFQTIMRMIVAPDVLSVIIVQQLVVFFLYLPANNQVFQNGEGIVGTLIVFLLASARNHTGIPRRSRETGRLAW